MVQVAFTNGYKQATSNPVYQWDYGRELYIYGLESTDATIQVHFSDRSCERTIVRLATFFPTDNVSNFKIYYKVQIPDELLENSYPINAFIYMVDAESGQTTHYINIPVVARKKPAGFISKPNETQTTLLEQGLIDINEANAALINRTKELTNYLNSEVDRIEDYVDAEVTELKTYTDGQIANAKTSAESYADKKYTSAISYIDKKVADNVNTLKDADTAISERANVIEERVNDLEYLMSLTYPPDMEMSDTSEFTVQNKIIKKYIDEQIAAVMIAVNGMNEVSASNLSIGKRYKVIDTSGYSWNATLKFTFTTNKQVEVTETSKDTLLATRGEGSITGTLNTTTNGTLYYDEKSVTVIQNGDYATIKSLTDGVSADVIDYNSNTGVVSFKVYGYQGNAYEVEISVWKKGTTTTTTKTESTEREVDLLENIGSYTGSFFFKVIGVDESYGQSYNTLKVTYELDGTEYVKTFNYVHQEYYDNRSANIEISNHTKIFLVNA